MKIQSKRAEDEKDPFLKLGEGIHGYRSVLIVFILLFLLLSILAVPIMYIYNQGGALYDEFSDSKYGNYSLGNMGFESNQCSFTPMITSKIMLQCPYGNITKLYAREHEEGDYL